MHLHVQRLVPLAHQGTSVSETKVTLCQITATRFLQGFTLQSRHCTPFLNGEAKHKVSWKGTGCDPNPTSQQCTCEHMYKHVFCG